MSERQAFRSTTVLRLRKETMRYLLKIICNEKQLESISRYLHALSVVTGVAGVTLLFADRFSFVEDGFRAIMLLGSSVTFFVGGLNILGGKRDANNRN